MEREGKKREEIKKKAMGGRNAVKWGTVVWSSQRQRRGATEAHVRRGALQAEVLRCGAL